MRCGVLVAGFGPMERLGVETRGAGGGAFLYVLDEKSIYCDAYRKLTSHTFCRVKGGCQYNSKHVQLLFISQSLRNGKCYESGAKMSSNRRVGERL